jgi:hypothetical protein
VAYKISLQMARNSPFVGKITGHFSLTVPLSLLEVSRVVVGVGAPGVASGNFQSRARTISLHGCSTSGGISNLGPIEEEEEEEVVVVVVVVVVKEEEEGLCITEKG